MITKKMSVVDWCCYFPCAVVGLVCSPSITDAVLGVSDPHHSEKSIFLVGTLLTTIGLAFIRLNMRASYRLPLICLVGFFSFCPSIILRNDFVVGSIAFAWSVKLKSYLSGLAKADRRALSACCTDSRIPAFAA